ncbi:LLM class flavin-dependent oxidoreductase [Actinoallomurus rhizosphaericola]|uniref:LLM class flavin-dependent oxidoreductase n=1 Tax=Actinoallomurus rhizosphaericola TaxID=2952536 RepID=UPI003873B152
MVCVLDGKAAQRSIGLIESLSLPGDTDITKKRDSTFECALEADRLGYKRLWLPEHHGPGSSCASPVLMSAVIGSHTRNIRVGTAATLLRIRDPYLTLVDFMHAAYVCKGRFDIGLGRGDVGGLAAKFIQDFRKDDEQLTSAIEHFTILLGSSSGVTEEAPYGSEKWLHGTGVRSAELAARLGFNYCHGLFLNEDVDACAKVLADYASAGSNGQTAVAVAFLVDPDSQDSVRARNAKFFKLSHVGSVGECARVAARALRATGASELVLAEMSSDPTRHLIAVRDLYHAISEELESGRSIGR